MATSTQPETERQQSQGSALNQKRGKNSDSPFSADALPSRPLQAMTRVFTRRDLFRGRAAWSLVWSICGGLVFTAVAISVWLLLNLLQTSGQLTLSQESAVTCNELTGVELAAGTTTDVGLRPIAWRMRDSLIGEHLAEMYGAIPMLQSNIAAFLTLLVAAIFNGLLCRWLFGQAKLSAARAGLDVTSRLRKSLHRQALRVGPGDLLESDLQRVRDLFLNEVSRLQFAIADRIYRWGSATVLAVAVIGLALLIDWRITLQCLIPLACCWYLYLRVHQRWVVARAENQTQLAEELGYLGSDFAKTRLIRGYGMENFEHRQFQNDLNAYDQRATRAASASQNLHLLTWLTGVTAATIVLFFLSVKILDPSGESGITLADGLALGGLLTLLIIPATWILQSRQDWRNAAPAAESIYRYLDRIPDVSQAVGAKFLQPASSSLQFEQISYDIPGGGKVLKGVDLKLPAGKVAAFVSHDPLPARSLAYLLPRFIEPTSGRVLVDGEDIAWVTLESLRAETAYVGGVDPWFTGSVLDNIRSGDERHSLQDVTAAAKTVHAHKFIAKLPQGYETILGESSVRLSAGESFRLALARAILQDPAVLIIEEPTVALDSDTKALIDDAYNRILKGRTVIFLPSRLSTVRRADFVVLLHNGKVEVIGSHAALVKTSPAYRHWEYQNFNEFRSGTDSD